MKKSDALKYWLERQFTSRHISANELANGLRCSRCGVDVPDMTRNELIAFVGMLDAYATQLMLDNMKLAGKVPPDARNWYHMEAWQCASCSEIFRSRAGVPCRCGSSDVHEYSFTPCGETKEKK